jgi:hypothetical protein
MEEGSSGGASPHEGFHEGDPGRKVPLSVNPKDGVFERLTGFPVDGRLSLWGTWRGFVCRDSWEIRKIYLVSFFWTQVH